jgi:hypothetical protein
MTPLLLTLACLLPSDGGPGAGAARAPVAVRFSSAFALPGRWVGTWEGTGWQGARDSRTVELAGGVLRTVSADGIGIRYDGVKVAIEGAGALRMTIWSNMYCPAIYRFEGDRLIICVGEGRKRPAAFRAGPHAVLLTLRPASPRKP